VTVRRPKTARMTRSSARTNGGDPGDQMRRPRPGCIASRSTRRSHTVAVSACAMSAKSFAGWAGRRHRRTQHCWWSAPIWWSRSRTCHPSRRPQSCSVTITATATVRSQPHSASPSELWRRVWRRPRPDSRPRSGANKRFDERMSSREEVRVSFAGPTQSSLPHRGEGQAGGLREP
jgi:hypothetical protein